MISSSSLTFPYRRTLLRVLAVGGLCLSGSTLVQASECVSLSATGNPEYPPFLWQSEAGHHLNGAVSHLLQRLAEKIQIPITTQYVGPWSRSQQEVRSGRVDLMAGAFYTSERADYMEYFSPAMMFTKSVVWQAVDHSFAYHQPDDLVGRWGVTVINNSFGQQFDEYARDNLNLLKVASLEQAFNMLTAGRADYVLYERGPGLAYAEHLGILEKVNAVEPSISSEGLFLAISKLSPCNTPEFKNRISIALSELVAQGVPQQAMLDGMTDWAKASR